MTTVSSALENRNIPTPYDHATIHNASPLGSPFMAILSGGILALGVNGILEELETQKKATNWTAKDYFRSRMRLSAEAFGVVGTSAELVGEATRQGYLPKFLSMMPLSFIGDITTFIYSSLKSLTAMVEFNQNFDAWVSSDSPEIRKTHACKSFSKMLNVACYASMIALTALHMIAITVGAGVVSSVILQMSSWLAVGALVSLLGSIVLDYHVKQHYETPQVPAS